MEGKEMKKVVDVTKTVDRLARAAEKLGYEIEGRSHASTGTEYLTLSTDDLTLKVRVADHGECYCHEDISIDPEGLTLSQGVEWLAAQIGQPAPSWIKASATRRANREDHEAVERARRQVISDLADAALRVDIEENRDAILASAKAAPVSRNALKRFGQSIYADETCHRAWVAAGRPGVGHV